MLIYMSVLRDGIGVAMYLFINKSDKYNVLLYCIDEREKGLNCEIFQ